MLDAWEKGLGRPPVERPLPLLSAFTGEGTEALSLLSIGRRDAALLALRESVFGPRLVCVASCPACGERLELTLEVRELLVGQQTEQTEQPSTISLETGGYEVSFRLPTTSDIAQLAISQDKDVEWARQMLLARCVQSATLGGAEVGVLNLPSNVLEAIAERMGVEDPQGDLQLSMRCPACAHGWQEAFDIGHFIWGELNAWATRTLGEVHRLARAYGWREADILSMSPLRRQMYLDMVGE